MSPTASQIQSKRGLASWPFYSPDEVEAAAQTLRSGKVNYWTGEEGRKFEAEFAQYVGSRKAVALANGTVALELALKALGIGAGDEVIVTPRSFMASASSVVLVGATPIFVDVELDSGNISPKTIEPHVTKRTKAIIPVHLGGWPCDMERIRALADSFGGIVIEDCAQAHGARIHGRSVGNWSEVASWSFCQDKIITTGGEGGMVTTDDENLWRSMWEFKDHGKSYEAVFERSHAPGFRWLHESFGTNWRLTEPQSAIGRLQLRKLDDWKHKRSFNAHRLADRLSNRDAVRFPLPPAGFEHAFYRLYGYIRPENLRDGWTRDRIMEAITDRGAPCFSGSCGEIYREKAFRDRGLGPEKPLVNARELADTSLAFLVHPTLGLEDIDYVGDVIDEVLSEALR